MEFVSKLLRKLQMQRVAGGAVHDGSSGNWLGYSAGAVGDGQGGGLKSRKLAFVLPRLAYRLCL